MTPTSQEILKSKTGVLRLSDSEEVSNICVFALSWDREEVKSKYQNLQAGKIRFAQCDNHQSKPKGC